MRNILFVCAGNTCRSPMAEAIARRLLGPDTRVESVGIEADRDAVATKNAVQTMKELGFDLTRHRSRSLNEVDLNSFENLIALSPAIENVLRGKVKDPNKITAFDIPDPYGKEIECYRASAAAIERGIRQLFKI